MLDTLVTTFEGVSDSSDLIRVLALDDEKNLDSDGEVKTSFYPGEVIHYIVHLSDKLKIKEVVATEGTVSYMGKSTRKTVDQVFFTNRDTSDLTDFTTSVIPIGMTKAFTGVRKGSPTAKVNSNGTVTYTAEDVKNVPYLLTYTHEYSVYMYRYTPRANLIIEDENESYPVGIVFYLEEV